jgi:hypothetical protein
MDENMVFTEKDYNASDGMMTLIWGPPMWHLLHTISFNYPPHPTKKQQTDYYAFYSNLKNILPCKYCRENLTNNLKKLPLTKSVFKNRETLSKWVYDLHEIVNTMLGKKSNLTYEMVRFQYEHFRSRCLDETKTKTKNEKGCTKSLHGMKGKCILSIVPKAKKINTFNMDPSCLIKRLIIKKK